jgi:hypothetical protein
MSSNIVDFNKHKEEAEETEFFASLEIMAEEITAQLEEASKEKLYAIFSAGCNAIAAGKSLDEVNQIVDDTTALYFPDEFFEDEEEIE